PHTRLECLFNLRPRSLGVPPHSSHLSLFFFFNDTATPEIYTLSLHDALPISPMAGPRRHGRHLRRHGAHRLQPLARSEEHTSELQSPVHLGCRFRLHTSL